MTGAPGAARRRTEVHLGTTVSITVLDADPDPDPAIARAFAWFRDIETCCSRFEPDSELRRLSSCGAGHAVPVSRLLCEVVRVALAFAEETGGAFDPTVGVAMERRGFDRAHRSGTRAPSGLETDGVSFRDVTCDVDASTITLMRPLLLDLGGVAKGLAIDLAARELSGCRTFAIDAGGDLYAGGPGPGDAGWSVGIRHPRRPAAVIETIHVANAAVCTSGDYERRTGSGHHLLDPRSGSAADRTASATVLAPTAMLADAIATAAFVLGPHDGVALAERLGLGLLLFTPDLGRHETSGWPRG